MITALAIAVVLLVVLGAPAPPPPPLPRRCVMDRPDTCDHDVLGGIDDTPRTDPAKRWRCDACGAVFTITPTSNGHRFDLTTSTKDPT